MSLQKQLLSNKRLWVRGLTLIVIIGVALLKPKFDEYMANRQSGDNSVAQTDSNSNSKNSNSRSASANASSDADLSLNDLLASIQEDSDDDSGNDKTTAANSSSKSSPKGTTSSSKLNPSGSNAADSKTTKKPDDKPRLGKLTLVRGTRDEFRSTAGLMYVPGSADGHRLKHVLKHAKDNPSKPVHGVFDGDRDQILEWIDKAYLMGKNGDKNARKESQRDRTVYTANLNQRVGYVGGQKGKRNNNKECRFLRLVIENGTEVVTAYPSDRM